MKNSEAISKIRFMLDVGGSDGFSASDKEALNMAINALSLHDEPKSNGDRIRQMTDEELGFWKACPVCESCAWFENRECDEDCTKYNCFNGAIEWLRKEVSEDADNSGS